MSSTNKHDIVGVPGILDIHRKEFEKKKLSLRIENEKYLRDHPELTVMLKMFVQDVLNDYPENILEYAGSYFDVENMNEIVAVQMELEKNT
jgi:ERCC4-type nuclease